jgi:hypothetical protein
MVVKDDLDRGIRWVGGIEEFEELDKFAAAMAVLDQGVNVTGPSGSECRAAYTRDRA